LCLCSLEVLPSLPGALPIFTIDAIAARSLRYASEKESHLRTSQLFQHFINSRSLYLTSYRRWRRTSSGATPKEKKHKYSPKTVRPISGTRGTDSGWREEPLSLPERVPIQPDLLMFQDKKQSNPNS